MGPSGKYWVVVIVSWVLGGNSASGHATPLSMSCDSHMTSNVLCFSLCSDLVLGPRGELGGFLRI